MTQLIMKIKSSPALSYPIMIEKNLLMTPTKWMPRNWQSKKIVIITDDTVNLLYGKRLVNCLTEYNPLLLSFPAGESSKNFQTHLMLAEKMLAHHCDRETLILALGGGVVGDLAGFLAATYMRGISYIQVPTTLLAMIDSSIGGKTGVNLKQGKNLMGSFWQPQCVVIDLNCLNTLSDTHLINGLCEAIKIFLTKDANYFKSTHESLDAILNKDLKVLKPMIEQAIKLKMSIVSEDQKEKNKRMILNFGHTIGHALEALTNFNMLHGFAVALGILVEAKIAEILGFLSKEDYALIQSIFKKLQITKEALKDFDLNQIIAATQVDKKMKAGEVRYVLIKKIGEVYQPNQIFAHHVPDEVVKRALVELVEVSDGG